MTRERWFTPWRTACFALIVMSGLAFAASLPGQAIWDDIPLLNGTGIGGGKSLLHVFTRPFLDNYFRPLVSLSFYLERPLWGSGPFGYHQTNLIIHALNTALMLSLLQAAFRSRRIAFAGATIFAFHPVHVSSVAWIGGRTDPMLCLFMSCAALCLIRSARAEDGAWRRPLGWAAWWYFLALLCKEQVLALLPLAPLAYRVFGELAWDGVRKVQARKAAYLFGAVAGLFIVCWFLSAPPKQSAVSGGIVSHLEQAGQTFFSYAGLLLAPNATWMHAFTIGPTEGFGWFGAVCGYVFVGALVALIVVAWRLKSQLAWWGLWSLLVLLPVSNLLPIATLLVAPYRAEIAQIGIAAIGGWAAVRAWERFRLPSVRYAMAFAGAFATAWCLHLCVWGSAKWINSETIFRQVCAVDPDCIFAREAVAQSLLNKRKYAEAGKEIEDLLDRIFPNGRWKDVDKVIPEMHGDTPIARKLRHNQGGTIDPNVWLSHIYAQLGSLRVRQGEKAEAETYLRAAVTLDGSCYEGLVELGFLTLERGEYAHAKSWASRAIWRAPTVADGYAVRGRALAALGKMREAQADFARCVELQPWAGQAYIELAETQVKLGDRQAAVATLSEALRRSPRRDDIRKRLAAL